jgi:HNH endonuclease
MSIKLLDRLLFAQGQHCFFCNQPLPRETASVEHLLAKSHSGTNELDNCVACCKAVNSLFGNMTLKEKMQAVLRQRGEFRCPRRLVEPAQEHEPAAALPAVAQELLAAAITHLERRTSRRPCTLPSLQQSLSDRYAKQLGGASAQALVDQLRLLGIVVLNDDGTLTYRSMQQSA